MLDKAIYTNHLSESIRFGQDGVFISDSQLRNYSWNYDTNFDEITNFRKGVVTKTLTIIICADTKEEGIQKRNRIYEVFDRDVLTQNAGSLYIGDYYCKGYFVTSEKSQWFISKRYLVNKVTFVSDSPDWNRYLEYVFKEMDGGSTTVGAKRYPYKYSRF